MPLNEFKGLKVSVIGAARSGASAAKVLVKLGAIVLLSDSSPREKLTEEQLRDAVESGAESVFEASVEQSLPEGTQLVVVSPGVPKDSHVLRTAVERGIRIWGEIEFAYRISAKEFMAVTGTNGKTTTTLLLSDMLCEGGKLAVPCGNVSADSVKKTLTDAAALSLKPEYAEETGEHPTGRTPIPVAEISSFQLEWTDKFAPHVAILTNITPDHLNRHKNFTEYAETKLKLFARQTRKDWTVLNWDDAEARKFGANSPPGRLIWFSTQASPTAEKRLWVRKGFLTARLNPQKNPTLIMPVTDIPDTLPGEHNVSNILAAASAAMAIGVSPMAIARAVRNFKGVPHRMEIIGEFRGIQYVNNSMCTNVVAAVCSLEAMKRPTIVICGGADKDFDFSPLVPIMKSNTKHAILIGSAAVKLEAALRAGGYENISHAETLESAVVAAKALATQGDAILLSPACASFGMFRDFEHRGQVFRNAVKE